MTRYEEVMKYLKGKRGYLGGFYSQLVEAALTADQENLTKIGQGFPEVEQAIRDYMGR